MSDISLGVKMKKNNEKISPHYAGLFFIFMDISGP